jgi:hypothetical protein
VDEIAAVKNHGGRNGQKNRRPERAGPPQRIAHQHQQQNQTDAKGDGDDAHLGVGKGEGILRRTKPKERQGKVVQRGAVVLVRVVLIIAAFPERGEFDGVDAFVVMERAQAELRRAEKERTGDRQQQRQCAPTIHLFGTA